LTGAAAGIQQEEDRGAQAVADHVDGRAQKTG